MRRFYTNPRPDVVEGPFTTEEIQGFIANSSLTTRSLLCEEGTEDWQEAYKFGDFDRRQFSRNVPSTQDLWTYVHQGQKRGPLRTDEIKAALEKGDLKLSDLVLIENDNQWVPLGSLDLFHKTQNLIEIEAPDATRVIHISGEKITEENPQRINQSFLELVSNVLNKDKGSLDGFQEEAPGIFTHRYYLYATLLLVSVLVVGLGKNFLARENLEKQEIEKKLTEKKPRTESITLAPKPSSRPTVTRSISSAPKPSPKKITPVESTIKKEDSAGYNRFDPDSPDEVLRRRRREIRENVEPPIRRKKSRAQQNIQDDERRRAPSSEEDEEEYLEEEEESAEDTPRSKRRAAQKEEDYEDEAYEENY